MKILDIGAAAGPDPPAYARLARAFPCDIVGFEPAADECEKLNRLNMPGHLYLPYAIADGSERTFYECSSPYCSSLFEPNNALTDKFHGLGDLVRVVGTRTLGTKRLDDLAETEGADFLKVDVQGGELLVLQGGVERLRAILAIHIEVEFLPLYKDQPLFADIDSFLRGQGFAFHTLIPSGRSFKPLRINNDDSGWFRQIIWADAVYVRDFMALSELAPESLLKLAAILHENYDSIDMAVFVLGAYDKQTGRSLQPNYLRRLSAP